MAGPVTRDPADAPTRPEDRTAPAEPDLDPVQVATEDALFRHMDRSPVTWSLIALMACIHVAVGLLMHARGKTDWLGVFIAQRGPRLLTRCGAMSGDRVDAGELWRLVSAVFLHGGPVHLVLNLAALYALGRVCEAVYGPVRFLWMFVVAGTIGATLSWVGEVDVSVGSSGAIFGLLGAAIVFGWRHRHQLPPDTGRVFRIKLLPWLALNLAIGFVVPFIDHMGHMGGLVAGVVLAMSLGNRIAPGEDTGWLAHALMLLGALLLLAAAAWGVWGRWA